MTRAIALIMVIAAAGCGSDDRPVNIPVVAAGASEADCQRLCTLAAGEEICTAKHAEFCVASCRARTNGLPAACASCVIAAGAAIHGYEQSGDKYCSIGGPGDVGDCATECDDGGGAPSPDLAVLCELECGFYMQEASPLACSEDGAADCRAACTAAVAGKGRVCAQCLAEQTIPSRTCINSDCDCEPFWNGDAFGCEPLCDALPPS